MKKAFYQFAWHLSDRRRTLLCAPLGIGAGIIGWKMLGWIEEVAHCVISFFFYSTVLGVVLNAIVTS